VKRSSLVLDNGLEALDSNLGQSLYGRAHTVYKRVWESIQHLPKLVADLDPLHNLFTGAAQQGAETRERIAKAVAETEAKVMAQMKKAGAEPAPAKEPEGPADPAGSKKPCG
jgi:hypothetical protein